MKFIDAEGIERVYMTKTVTIVNATSLSAVLDLEGRTIAGVLMPAAWTAANLTFQGADLSAGTFADVNDNAGAEVAVTAAAAKMITGFSKLDGLRFIKVRSGTSAVPVNQLADRVLTLILK